MAKKSKKQLKNVHYIGIAFATVLFWRAIWNIMDRIPAFDSLIADVATGTIALAMLWLMTKTFKHLD